MKIRGLIALLFGLAPAALAQSVEPRSDALRPIPRPHITFVETTRAEDPGSVEVHGTALGRITAARVSGAEVPILANDGKRIVLDVPPQVPGFGQLELLQPQDVQRVAIEFTPSLRARYAPGAGSVQLTLNSGMPGLYLVSYSYRAREQLLTFPGTYHGLMLDMSSPFSGTLFSGLTDVEVIDFPWIPLPRLIVGVGDRGITWGLPGSYLGQTRPLLFQALRGGAEPAYSNVVTLEFPPTL
jgi:hypothetical protein